MKLTTVQNITLSCTPDVTALYRHHGGDTHRSAGRVPTALKASDEISFEAYFNVFYERQFALVTGIDEITLTLHLKGEFRVEVFRSTDLHGGHQIIYRDSFASEDTSEFRQRIALCNQPHASGFLFAVIKCLSKTGFFYQGAWQTSAVPRSQVHLAVALTTFRRTEFARRVLLALNDSELLAPESLEFVVVDNSNNLSASDFLPTDQNRLLHPYTFIRQDNLGGAGGFGRALLETLSGRTRKKASHILFMDDDIRVEPETVFRTIQLLKFASCKVVIGAPMFDLHQPTRLAVLSESIETKRHSLYPTLCEGDFTPVGFHELLRVANAPDTAWTCWWYSAFPLEAFKDHGMPLPCFIHGDDVEVGYRLRSKGYRVLYYPGLAAWHEPFHSKIATWMEYYNVRNALICRCLHLPDVRMDQLIETLFRTEVGNALDTFNYGSAQAMLCGIEHFLDGPSILANNHTSTLHAGAQRAYQEFAPKVWQDDWPRKPTSRQRRRFTFRHKALRSLLFNGHIFPWLRRREGEPPRLVMKHGYHRPLDTTFADSIALHEVWSSQIRVYDRSNATYWRLRRRSSKLRARLIAEFEQVKDAWRQAHSELTSTEFWNDYVANNEK